MKRLTTLGTAALLGACGGAAEPTSDEAFCARALSAVASFMAEAGETTPAPDHPRYGGTVVVGGYGEMSGGMNAVVAADAVGAQHHQFVLLMTLIDYDASFEPRPYLAESWELAPDSTSITFRLRQDVVWHDGERTDAHDVAFTWAAVNDPLTGYPNAASLQSFVKGPEGFAVLDDFTVEIRMQPHPQFMDVFRALAILPEHLLGDAPRDELVRHPYGTQCPVGNGPFVFEEHRPQDRWVFTANPAFPEGLGGRPFVDRYVYRVITEQTTLLTELLTENVDVYIAPAAAQAQQIVRHPNLELRSFMPRQYNLIAWNSRRPQLADARVRRALTMGLDRETIVEAVVQGYGTVAHTGVAPYHWAYDPSAIDLIPYDPEGARALLDEAGWRDRDGDGVREAADGTPLSISIKYNASQIRQQIAEIAQAQLYQIGVGVQPRMVEYTTLVEQVITPEVRDFDGVVWGWTVGFEIDETEIFHSDRVDEPLALSGTRNAEMDRLTERLRLVSDRDAARRLWTEYQQLVIEEQPYTFLYFPDGLAGINRRVRDVVMDARGEWVNVKDWYLDPAGP